MSGIPEALSKLVLLIGLGWLLLGRTHAGAAPEPVIGFAVLLWAASWAGRRLVDGRHRRAWRRALREHRPALMRRYRQLVRVNDYGAEEFDKWYAELDRFRGSTGLPDDPRIVRAFEADATARVARWIAEERLGPDAPVFAGHDPTAYEHHCAELLRRAGWDAEVTAGTGDQGIDVLARRGEVSVALQCKLHNNAVGNKAVQEAHAAMGFVDADAAAVVSNADYTASARELAGKIGVLLLHHDDLPGLDGLVGGTSPPRRLLKPPARTLIEPPRRRIARSSARP